MIEPDVADRVDDHLRGRLLGVDDHGARHARRAEQQLVTGHLQVAVEDGLAGDEHIRLIATARAHGDRRLAVCCPRRRGPFGRVLAAIPDAVPHCRSGDELAEPVDLEHALEIGGRLRPCEIEAL
jgi:hypothetical protein